MHLKEHKVTWISYCGIVTNILINFHFTLFLGVCKPIILLRIQSIYVKGCCSHKRQTVIQLVGTSRDLGVHVISIMHCNYHS